MGKIRSICWKALLVCMVLLLLTGCGAGEEPQAEQPREDQFSYDTELTAENSVEITVVNANGRPVRIVGVQWDGQEDTIDLLRGLGRNLEPGEVITLRIPKTDESLYYLSVRTDEDSIIYDFSPRYIPEGSVLVIPPYSLLYDEYGIQIVFEAGTDVETARETTLSELRTVYGVETETEKEEDPEREAINEAVKLLGYDSLADMRTELNPDITFRDYIDEYERNRQEAYYDLYGYWYPNGDRNSLTYIGITNMEFMWYQFDPEQGDVELGRMRLSASSGGAYRWTFTLADGNKFTVERTSLLEDVSKGTLTFEDCTKEYSDSVEFYYSKY